MASAANSFVSPRTDECVAVVGDCIANEVSLVSAKQVSFFSPEVFYRLDILDILTRVSRGSLNLCPLILKVVVGRNGLPVAMSPLVATLIESLVNYFRHI